MLKMTAALALLACAFAASAGAATTDEQFGTELNTILTQNAAAAREIGKDTTKTAPVQEPGYRTIWNVMTAMNDAPGTGEMLVQWLRERTSLVEFSEDAQVSRHEWRQYMAEGIQLVIQINPAMAKKDRPYPIVGSLIAKEAAEMMLDNFPDSAEKSYMVAARMAEVYLELAGSGADLKAFCNDASYQEACKKIRLWAEYFTDPASGVAFLHKQGAISLTARAALQAEIRKAEDAYYGPTDNHEDEMPTGTVKNKSAAPKTDVDFLVDFAAFKKYESDWMINHQHVMREIQDML